MCNKQLLTAKMLLSGRQFFVKDLAKDLGISTGSASLKLRGELPFKQEEMIKAAKLYHLTGREFIQTFFPELEATE